MLNSNGTQAVADEKQTIVVLDHEACGSEPAETPRNNTITRRKTVLVISAAVVVIAAAAYFAWNAFHYEVPPARRIRHSELRWCCAYPRCLLLLPADARPKSVQGHRILIKVI